MSPSLSSLLVDDELLNGLSLDELLDELELFRSRLLVQLQPSAIESTTASAIKPLRRLSFPFTNLLRMFFIACSPDCEVNSYATARAVLTMHLRLSDIHS